VTSPSEHEARLRRLFEEFPDGVVVVDSAGTVQSCNPAAERFLGQRTEDLKGQRLDVSIEFDFPVEIRAVADDGTLRYGEALASPVEWAGQPGYVVSIRNVTERRRAESMHRALADQRRQSERLEAVARVAESVGHGFNEQLAAIQSYAEFLLHHVSEGDPAREDVRAIDAAVRRAASLAQQLLAFTRVHALRPVQLDVHSAIHDLTGMLHRLLGPEVRLQLDLAANSGSVLFDPSQIGQVIASLASWARETMSRGGELAIATDRVLLDEPRAEGLGLPTNDVVRITMKDDGAGMDEQTLSRLFEPRFTTLHESGNDPDLSTVYGVIKQSQGAITVYSEPGRGTRFEIYLPRSAQEPVVDASPGSERAPGGATVLVVEDEEIVRRATCRALREHGYQVLQARSGVDALEVESTHEGLIDLLLTDVVMPGMSGPELAERMRQRRPGIGVVFMSGFADDRALGQDGVEHVLVAKPFPIAQLMKTLRTVLERRTPVP
jgi:two-component system cell cycle sensor histidine kinase/response regulator CckA